MKLISLMLNQARFKQLFIQSIAITDRFQKQSKTNIFILITQGTKLIFLSLQKQHRHCTPHQSRERCRKTSIHQILSGPVVIQSCSNSMSQLRCRQVTKETKTIKTLGISGETKLQKGFLTELRNTSHLVTKILILFNSKPT